MSEYTVSQWVLFFYFYCFVGWVWESSYVSFLRKKWVNRGFLKGPFLPIYGSGAMCILISTLPVRGNIPAMFVVGMVSATVLEYITGYVMERLFKVRYWDYTDKFLNINGYICLSSTLCWGVMTVLLVQVFHGYVERIVLSINEKYIDILVMIMTPLLTADFVTSFSAALKLRDILDQKQKIAEEMKKFSEKKEELQEALRGSGGRAKEQIRQELQELYTNSLMKKGTLQASYQHSMKSVRGLLRRNPSASSGHYKESLADLKIQTTKRIEDILKEADERFDMAMSGANEWFSELKSTTGEKFGDLKSTTEEKLGELKSTTEEKLGDLKNTTGEKLGELKSTTEEKLGDLKNTTEEKLGELKSTTGERLEELKSATGEKLGELKSTTGEMLGGLRGTAGDQPAVQNSLTGETAEEEPAEKEEAEKSAEKENENDGKQE